MKPLCSGVLMALGLISLTGSAHGQVIKSYNGKAEFFSVDSFTSPAGSPHYVDSYTGKFANGVSWSLSGEKVTPTMLGGLTNPYHTLIKYSGETIDSVGSGKAPWQNSLTLRDGKDFLSGQSAFGAYGADWGVGTPVNYINMSAQTYESAINYTMTFGGSTLNEIYMYVYQLDDGQMSGWNITPEIIQTSTLDKAQLVYTDGALRDFDAKGEGMDIGSDGINPIILQSFGTIDWRINPSAGGVVRFYSEEGFDHLSWTVELNPNSVDKSDGFQIAFATPVPEPSAALLFGFTGALGLLRRRRR